jgi:hypothetical protein
VRIIGFLLFVFGFHLTASAQVSPAQLVPDPGFRVQPSFRYRLDPVYQSLALGSSISFRVDMSGVIVARRILSDPSHHRYFGYEMLLEPQVQADRYLVSFQDLNVQAAGLSTTGWTVQSPAVYPPQRIMREGEEISVDLGTLAPNDETTGKIIDDVLITQLQPRTQLPIIWETDLPRAMAYKSSVSGEMRKRGLQPNGIAPVPPVVNQLAPIHVLTIAAGTPQAFTAFTITGTPQAFTVADAELQVGEPSLSVNERVASAAGSLKATHGALIYFYVPGRGRYILSLVPRPELGFTRVGEASGGFLKWTADNDTFSVESSVIIAPGGGPFFIYVLHDPEWQPTASAARGRVLTGSVAPEEITILRGDSGK